MHTPQPAAVVTGVPFSASTEYDNQYIPKSLTFNQLGSHGGREVMGNSGGHIHKLPTVSSETTNQHFYPYWGVPPPQKKGYAVRCMAPAPPLDFAGDTFTTTNAVEYQPKPSSYVRPAGTGSCIGNSIIGMQTSANTCPCPQNGCSCFARV